MVSKRDLAAMICNLENAVCDLEFCVHRMDRDLDKVKKSLKEKKSCKCKKPCSKKAIKADKQPRDKSGKFIKK